MEIRNYTLCAMVLSLLLTAILAGCLSPRQSPAPSPLAIPSAAARSEPRAVSPLPAAIGRPQPSTPAVVHIPMVAEDPEHNTAPEMFVGSFERLPSIDPRLLLGSIRRISLFGLSPLSGATPQSAPAKRIFVPLVRSLDQRVLSAQARYDCSKVQRISREQCDALLVFYALTNGHVWGYQTDWLTGNDPCMWNGLRCPEPEFNLVKVLHLPNRNLTGILPAEISQLPLTFLHLYGNRLTGPIPPSIVHMRKLEEIRLEGNQLTGEVPSGIVALPDLRMLELGRNAGLYFNTGSYTCAGAPPQTRYECEALVAIYRQMSGPNWKFAGNELNVRAWLVGPDHCKWHGVECLGGYVVGLKLRRAQISGPISQAFASLSQLSWLDLAENQLTGPIPEQFGFLEHLRYLNLSANDPTLCMPWALHTLVDEYIRHDYFPPPGGYC